MRRIHAFTLTELLVVIAVIAIGMGMISGTTLRRDERRAQVQGAAAEVASTLRQARAYAMERNIVAAVSFNICNAPGSSGWSLNNRSGGHWYQILGPGQTKLSNDEGNGFQSVQAGHFPFPERDSGGGMGGGDYWDKAIRYYIEAMNSAWYGDRHVLPKAKVRFLAIGDQDNGLRHAYDKLYQPAGSNWFYPRPWFGRWDDAGKRMHPWGGYEPAIKDTLDSSPTRTYADTVTKVSPTAFFYEGKDGPVTGCLNQQDRLVYDDSTGDMTITQATEMTAGAPRYMLWKQGNPRPLVNADWLDLYLVFYPDGTIAWGMPMTLRRLWGNYKGVSMRSWGDGGTQVIASNTYQSISESANNVQNLGPGDRVSSSQPTQDTSQPFVGLWAPNPQRMFEVSNYDQHTGAFYITLGPDLTEGQDDGRFTSAQQAVDALMPMYRVYAKPGGEIGWFEVRRSPPTGTTITWDPGVTAASWSNSSFLQTNYPDGSLRNADTSPRGSPVTDMLTTEMLVNATWWKQ